MGHCSHFFSGGVWGGGGGGVKYLQLRLPIDTYRVKSGRGWDSRMGVSLLEPYWIKGVVLDREVGGLKGDV